MQAHHLNQQWTNGLQVIIRPASLAVSNLGSSRVILVREMDFPYFPPPQKRRLLMDVTELSWSRTLL